MEIPEAMGRVCSGFASRESIEGREKKELFELREGSQELRATCDEIKKFKTISS